MEHVARTTVVDRKRSSQSRRQSGVGITEFCVSPEAILITASMRLFSLVRRRKELLLRTEVVKCVV